MKKTLIISIILFSVLTCTTDNAVGQTLTFSYEGIIDTIDDNTNDAIPGLHLNQQFNGWFQYEIIPDQFAETYYGMYHQDASIVFNLDDFTISYLDDFVYVRVLDGNTGSSQPSHDGFSFAVDGQHGDYSFTNFGISLDDSTKTVFDSDALPTSLVLSQFDSPRFLLMGYKNGDWFSAEGQLTDLDKIPEPATLFLLGLGSFALLKKRKA